MKKYKQIVSAILAICMLAVLTPSTCFAVEEDENKNFYGKEYTTTTANRSYVLETEGTTTYEADDTEKAAIKAIHMRALCKWTPKADASYYCKYVNGMPSTDPKYKIKLKAEEKYKGILYQLKPYNKNDLNEGSREHWFSTSAQVQSAVDDMISSGADCARGTDCSSSVCYAWRSAVLGSNDRTNGILMSTKSRYNGKYRSAYNCKKIVLDGYDTKSNNAEGYGNYVDRVGQYGKVADKLKNDASYRKYDTKQMLTALNVPNNFTNNADVYTRVYSKMHPGDFLVQYYHYEDADGKEKISSHVRLVERIVINKKDGKINPDASYVVMTEQTPTIRKCTNTAFSPSSPDRTFYSTWRLSYGQPRDDTADDKILSKQYTFKYLVTKGYYLPYRYNGIRAGIVSNVVANSVSSDCLSLDWGELNEENCDGYELEYAEDSSFENPEILEFDDSSLTSVTLDELQKDKTYFVRMRSYIINEDGTKEYSDYNNWLKVNLATGGLYRENAPDRTEVSEKEYYDYVVNDNSYDDDTDEITLEETDIIQSPFFS